MTPLRWGRRRWQERRFQHCGEVQIEILFGDVRQAKFETNHFTLFSGAESPGHRTRRLRQNRRMSRTATTAHGAPTAMEQQQFDLLFAANVHQRSEEHTSELQSLMRNSYAVFCLKKQKHRTNSM